MHLLNQRALGVAILLLLGMLVVVKQKATGSILDKPRGKLLVWIVNAFNLCFLLIVNPLAALLLITLRLETVDPGHLILDVPWLLTVLEMAGLALYVMGFLLMAWALTRLGGRYQPGGVAPRDTDEMVTDGPYGLIRHPMYTAALSISLGLTCLTQSLVLASVFCIYLVLIVVLIPMEEEGLRHAYGQRYLAYQHKVSKLLPLCY
jgi:protein-S-isoprenylcysteine O-methyltransferase Ste14